MRPATLIQALVLLLLAVIGAAASDPAAGACPSTQESVVCDL